MIKRRLSLGSFCLVALYLLFGGLSAVCVATADAAAPSHHHHSHQGMAHHSGLCAWACQVSPASAVLSSAPRLPSLGLAVSSAPTVGVLASTVSFVFIPSRAPPR